MVVVLTATSVLLPMQTYADSGQFVSKWIKVRTTNTSNVYIPAGNWVDIGRVRGAGSSTPKMEMIKGQKWITLARDEVGMLGLSSGQVADVVKQFPGRTMQVFARYSPENSQLRVALIRMEQRPDGFVYVSKGDWTPHHGEFYKAYRNFLTPTEKADPNQIGYNPFQSFRGDNTDPVFYNISFSAALVAIGLAMRLNQAGAAWLAVSSSRLDVQTHESGNIFRKTVTTTVDGKTSPVWYFVSAPELQPYGGASGQICASPAHVIPKSGGGSGDTTCDASEHFVQAGVVASQWSGGNMPSQEDTVYHWETSNSSLSVFSYVVITFLLFWAGGAAIAAGAGDSATAGAAAAAGGTSTGSSALIGGIFTAPEFAGLAAGTYAVGSTGFGTNAGLTYAQGSYAGSTGAGVLSAPVASSDQEAGLKQGVRIKQISQPLTAGLSATRQLYLGNCPENMTTSECNAAGLTPGVVKRADTYLEENVTMLYRQRYAACISAGYTGVALNQCAAAVPSGAFTDPD